MRGLSHVHSVTKLIKSQQQTEKEEGKGEKTAKHSV